MGEGFTITARGRSRTDRLPPPAGRQMAAATRSRPEGGAMQIPPLCDAEGAAPRPLRLRSLRSQGQAQQGGWQCEGGARSGGEIGGGLRGVLSFGLQTRSARLLKRGTSGSVQRGPANPARPGREQRYRVSQVCRGDPEVPRFKAELSAVRSQRPAIRKPLVAVQNTSLKHPLARRIV